VELSVEVLRSFSEPDGLETLLRDALHLRAACSPLRNAMLDNPEVFYTAAATSAAVLRVLKTLELAGSLHGYGFARQIEQTSADLFSVNYT
jgi:hypothetical protein